MKSETIKDEVTREKGSVNADARRDDTGGANAGFGHTHATLASPVAPVVPAGADAEVSQITNVTEARREPDGGHTVVETTTERHTLSPRPRNRNMLIVAVIALVALAVIFFLWSRRNNAASPGGETNAEAKTGEAAGEDHGGEAGEVKIDPEALAAAGIEIEGVTQRPAVALLRVTGAVEANPRQTQQATPLIGGRIERVNVALGDNVRQGSVLAVIASPEVAEMHGKLHEAETRLALAERNLQRVQRAENRVAVLSAKARLDEAEATLRRTRRLIELGAGAGKDLMAAETAYRTAKAEYDFQSNISLNRELQEARAEVETARVDVGHIRDQMRALGAPVPEGGRDDDHSRDTSVVAVRAPVSGTVTERLVNPGAGVEAGKSLFTISNLSTVYVIANVPEAQIGSISTGTRAEIRTPALGAKAISGRVSYIDSQLDETTRTARARIEMANPGGRLRAGMFVDVGFETGTGQPTGEELVVASTAVQRIGDRSVVFIPKETEPGVFEIRDVDVGGETEGYQRVISGLQLGDKVVTKGSFTLKAQMMKGELGDEH